MPVTWLCPCDPLGPRTGGERPWGGNVNSDSDGRAGRPHSGPLRLPEARGAPVRVGSVACQVQGQLRCAPAAAISPCAAGRRSQHHPGQGSWPSC